MRRLKTPQHGFYTGQQFAQVHWLHQIVVGAHFQADDAVDHLAGRCQHDHGNRGLLAQETGETEAVLARHVDVEEDQIYLVLVDRGPQGFAPLGLGDAVAVQLEIVLQGFPDVRLVVHHEDVGASCHRAHALVRGSDPRVAGALSSRMGIMSEPRGLGKPGAPPEGRRCAELLGLVEMPFHDTGSRGALPSHDASRSRRQPRISSADSSLMTPSWARSRPTSRKTWSLTIDMAHTTCSGRFLGLEGRSLPATDLPIQDSATTKLSIRRSTICKTSLKASLT
jgi:hypothetical protein